MAIKEVFMSSKRYLDEFKIEAFQQITEGKQLPEAVCRGLPIALFRPFPQGLGCQRANFLIAH